MTLAEMLEANPHVQKIRRKNPALANKLIQQGGFVIDVDLPELIQVDPHLPLLVRCGRGRFTCDVSCVSLYVEIISEHAKLKAKETGKPEVMVGDYVRDVSILAS